MKIKIKDIYLKKDKTAKILFKLTQKDNFELIFDI